MPHLNTIAHQALQSEYSAALTPYVPAWVHPHSLLSGNPIPLFQLFAQQYYCTWKLSPSHQPIESQTVEDVLHNVGQAYTAPLGSPDPCLNSFGQLEYVLPGP